MTAMIDMQLIENAKNISGIYDDKTVLEQALVCFIQSFQSPTLDSPQLNLMQQLRQIKIQAPVDFTENFDAYLNGEKTVER